MSGIQILAIDTYQNSPSINITGDDGAAIQQYYMYGGNWQNSPPPPGNFVFTTSQYGTTSYTISTIPAMPYAAASATPGISSITVTVGASDVTQDFVGACYGDQNLSYLPA
ncbi:MAG: hypothetical protein NTX79_01305 [Candidatus Micrarchaeota archaeon]|nr:hypothetical protein [Candidatus Micrarchaeota archaeon]